MITPNGAYNKTFKTGRGYSKDDVDNFFQSFTADYDAVYTENLDLKSKIASKQKEIDNYKAIEKNLEKSLLLAQVTSEESIKAAREEADRIESEAKITAANIIAKAKIEAEKIVNDASAQAMSINAKTTVLKIEYEKFRAQVKALAQAEIALLDAQTPESGVEAEDSFEDSYEEGGLVMFSDDFESIVAVPENMIEELDDKASAKVKEGDTSFGLNKDYSSDKIKQAINDIQMELDNK